MTSYENRFSCFKVLSRVKKMKPQLVLGTSFAIAPALLLLGAKKYRIWFDFMDNPLQTRSVSTFGRKVYFNLIETHIIRVIAARATFLTFISTFDKGAESYKTNANTFVIPNETSNFKPLPYVSSQIKRLVHVGDLNYLPNFQAALHLLSLKNELPIELAIYGNTGKKTEIIGATYAIEESDLYRPGDVHICLSNSLAGLKNKVINPLVNGIPVLTTLAGNNGISPTPGIVILTNCKPNTKEILDSLATFNITNDTKIWNGFLQDETPELSSKLLDFNRFQ